MTSNTHQGFSLRSVGRSAVILGGGVGAIQVLSIAREIFVAAKVGVSAELDALLIALALPMTIAGVMSTGAADALVPAYLGVRRRSGIDAARRLSGGILTWVTVGGLGLAALLVLLSSQAVAITGPGLSPVGREAATGYVTILAPLAVISAATAVLTGVSQAEERFAAIALAGFVGSAAALVATVGLWDQLGLSALAIGSLLGPVVTAGILLGSLAHGRVLPRPTLRLGGQDSRPFLKQAMPLTLSSVLGQLGVVADRAIASLLAPGAVSALRYGEVLVRAPITAISPAWSSAIYPALVRAAQGSVPNELATATERALRFATVAFVPMAALTAAVAPVAVSVALQRGAFGATDVSQTAVVVAAFAPLIAILMTSPVLARAHLARGDGRVLLTASVIRFAFGISLNVVLGLWLGVAGIALSTAITSGIVIVYFARRLGADEQLGLRPLRRVLVLATLASLVPALPIAALAWGGFVPTGTIEGILALVAFGVLGLLTYGIAATRMGLEEPRVLLATVFNRNRGKQQRPLA